MKEKGHIRRYMVDAGTLRRAMWDAGNLSFDT